MKFFKRALSFLNILTNLSFLFLGMANSFVTSSLQMILQEKIPRSLRQR